MLTDENATCLWHCMQYWMRCNFIIKQPLQKKWIDRGETWSTTKFEITWLIQVWIKSRPESDLAFKNLVLVKTSEKNGQKYLKPGWKWIKLSFLKNNNNKLETNFYKFTMFTLRPDQQALQLNGTFTLHFILQHTSSKYHCLLVTKQSINRLYFKNSQLSLLPNLPSCINI